MSSFICGSTIGLLPLLMMSTLVGLTSTPITSCPACAKHAAETQPTYPIPKMLIFIVLCVVHRFHRFLCNLWMAFGICTNRNEALGDLLPAEILSHNGRRSLAQLFRIRVISQHANDSVGERRRLVG